VIGVTVTEEMVEVMAVVIKWRWWILCLNCLEMVDGNTVHMHKHHKRFVALSHNDDYKDIDSTLTELIKSDTESNNKSEDELTNPEKLATKIPCDPGCYEERGICNNGICFCRTPWEGRSCTERVVTEIRFSYPMLFAATLISLIAGIITGCQVIKKTENQPIEMENPPKARKETWIPR